MALADDSILVTPGSGASVATSNVAGKEHQVVMLADHSGHIQGSLPTYFYTTPPIAVGANKLMFDIFNAAGSNSVIDIRGVWIVPNTTVAVTGVVGVRLDAYRTNTVGTGGTAASTNSATIDVAGGNFTKFDENNAALPAQITARVAPSGGAAIVGWLFPMSYFPEETQASPYITPGINWIPALTFGQKLVLRQGQGLLIRQGPIASVGSCSFTVAFTVEAG